MSEDALKAARALAAEIDPLAAAVRTGGTFDGNADAGSFSLRFLGDDIAIDFPGFEFEADCALPPHVRALLVYYLARSSGSTPTGEWRAFCDLPSASFYARAFQGYTGDALVRRVGDRATELGDAVVSLGGRTLAPGELETNADGAWLVLVLPSVPVALVWWNADDEFPARAELLFDATASEHLPTDGCAVLGSWLTTQLIARVERADR